jgi:hypothetical protein
MKKIIFLLIVAAGIAWFALHDSDLDKLMKRQPITEQSGIRLIEYEPGYVDVERYIERGLITIIYFYSENCPGTPLMDVNIKSLLKVRPDVAVRKFSLGKRWSEEGAYKKYKLDIGMSPFFIIYKTDGKIIAADKGTKRKAETLLLDWITAELNKH